MLDRIRRLFEITVGAGTDSEVDAVELATAVLLVEMQRADAENGAEETATISSQLARHFHLNDEAVAELVRHAEHRADHSVSLHEFTRLIHQRLTVAQKTTVLEMLWQVALADGRVDAHEDHLIGKVAELLYMPPGASAKARERAEKQRPGA